MIIIVSIVAVILLAGMFALIKLTPHAKAGISERPHPSHSGSLHPNETRSSHLN
jgi:hypothetical protein